MTIQTLWTLFCEADSLEEAQNTFRQSEHCVPLSRDPQGQPAFGVALCPPATDAWLRYQPPVKDAERTLAGWGYPVYNKDGEIISRYHVEIPGAANARIVELRRISVPGMIPHHAGQRNG